ncbi:zinc finger protein 711 isoform X2 [Bactrocera oleae]|uniref:zinc finger protein 711 isoform X2 n=1 Tax=Bactrocera oleae TaxID=104688 RepID=UPI00387E2445
MDATAATRQVCINSRPPSSYNVICNKCNSLPKFAHFVDFLDHSRAVHGPIVRRSALSIVAEDTLVSARGSISHLSAHSCASPTFTGSSLSNTISDSHFDLNTLKRQSLLDVIGLLNKCFCIWHRPSRECMPRSERLHAYQLLLLKLREHMPFVTFRDARSIVQQIIRIYLRKQRLGDADGASPKDRVDDDAVHWRVSRQLRAMKSKAVLDKLTFLRGCDDKDVEELVPDKHCAFCNIGFQNTETLWTHMVSAHLPARKQQRNSNIMADTMVSESTMDTVYSSGRRSHVSRSTFDTATDTTQQSQTVSEPTNLRRSRRRRRGIFRNRPYLRAKNKVVSLKRLRQRPQSSRHVRSDGDSVSVETKFSTSHLPDYTDQFLEEFIDLYREQTCLWQTNSPEYRNRKLRQAAYDVLHKKYCQSRNVPSVSLTKIKSLIRKLRYYYDRLQQPHADRFRSQIWRRMSFIDSCRTPPKRKRSHSADTYKTIVYDCSECPRKFKRPAAYAKHILKTHPPTECPPCNENFNSADELVHHLLYMHRKETDCPLCKEGQNEWRSASHLNQHFFEHRCPTCAEIFRDGTNYRRHRAKCRNINRFRCKHCASKFTSTMDFRRHAMASHQEDRPFRCEDCEVSFKYLAPLAKHRRLHKRVQSYYAP